HRTAKTMRLRRTNIFEFTNSKLNVLSLRFILCITQDVHLHDDRANGRQRMAALGTSTAFAAEEAQLRASVDALDPIVALLSLVHITGDRSLLTSLGRAFEGTRRGPQSTFAGPLATAEKAPDPALVAEIRERLVQVMLTRPAPLLTHPGRALFQQMA